MDELVIGECFKEFVQETVREMIRNGEFYIDELEEGVYSLNNLGE